MFLKFHRLWSRATARAFTALARGGFRAFGRKSVIVPPLRIGGEDRISVGSGVFIGSDSWLQHMDGGSPGDAEVIQIGDGASIAGHCTITACRSVVLEDNVLLARHVYISDHSHEFCDPHTPIKDQGITGVAPVRIKQGAWLGQGVVVCPGVTIGQNAVIGANSVVREDVPDHCVAVGAPARVVRKIQERETA
ncbi:MAG: acyltransferase [Verrucomicrobiota bacterium]